MPPFGLESEDWARRIGFRFGRTGSGAALGSRRGFDPTLAAQGWGTRLSLGSILPLKPKTGLYGPPRRTHY